MSETINIALLGLGAVGQEFAAHFLEQIQEGHKPIKIVAVAERDAKSPFAMGFAQNNVPVFEDACDVATLGDQVDIIFDLTGNADIRQSLRNALQESDNRHTVIAPEVFARLLWNFFDGAAPNLPKGKNGGY